MERRATTRLLMMKKLTGTNWGASSSIPRQVYTGNVHPLIEYEAAAAAWAMSAKSNISRLATVQNKGMRFIRGVIKTTHPLP